MVDKIKILVVDDSLTYRSILSMILRGFQEVMVVGTASNGQMALEKILLLKPDMITLDLEMPVMNGLETLRRLSYLLS